MKISDIKLRTIYNFLGDKTIEAIINNKFYASSSVGVSRGKYEVKTILIEKAIPNFNRIKEEFLGTFTQNTFDAKLKRYAVFLGSNATTALSLAFFSSTEIKNTFPNLLGNIMDGGAHSRIKTKMSIQEILTLPSSSSVPKSIDTNIKIWKEIGKIVDGKLGIESGWSSDITNEEALSIVSDVAKKYNASIGIDFAASHFYKYGKYIHWNKKMSRNLHISYVVNLAKKFNLVYIEDPLEQNDFSGFAMLKKKLKNTIICGDDLTTTNPERLKTAVEKNAINAIIVKPNQIGNVTDCINVIETAKKHSIVPVVSHRAGETKDVTICKLAQLAPLAKLGVAGNRKVKLDEMRRMWFSVKNPKMSKFPNF